MGSSIFEIDGELVNESPSKGRRLGCIKKQKQKKQKQN